MNVHPYLFFEGRCEEAITFYREKLGAELVSLMRIKESPEPMPAAMCPPGSDEKVMHADFKIGDSTIMASDGRCSGKPVFNGVTLSLNAANPAEAERLFSVLADGGQIHMPMGKTFFAPAFGMVADRFGVSWMVIVPA